MRRSGLLRHHSGCSRAQNRRLDDMCRQPDSLQLYMLLHVAAAPLAQPEYSCRARPGTGHLNTKDQRWDATLISDHTAMFWHKPCKLFVLTIKF